MKDTFSLFFFFLVQDTCLLLRYIIMQCVQRTLDQLVAEGKVMEKVYGKQKVYSPDQVNAVVFKACITIHARTHTRMLTHNHTTLLLVSFP